MKAFLFYIFYAFIWVVTLLPLRVLYLLSDFFFLILYYFPSYRRDVVAKNLRNSFPEKTEKERKIIARRYYRHLADLFVETLKTMHMSPKQIRRRFTFRNLDMLDKYYSEGRDIIAVCSHYNNWEWLCSVELSTPLKTLTIYKPLSNKHFARMMIRLREKYGAETAPMSSILKRILTHRKKKETTISAFIADQTPPQGEHVFWTTFLNQDTSFYLGAEKVAVALDMAVVFVHISKIRRGYYQAEPILISDNPRSEQPGTITERHIRELERIIKEQPEYWLWSHRRWKHKRPENE